MALMRARLVVDLNNCMLIKKNTFVEHWHPNTTSHLLGNQFAIGVDWVVCAIHIIAEWFDNGKLIVFQHQKKFMDIPMIYKFIHIAHYHIVSLPTRMLPAVVFDIIVDTIVKSASLKFNHARVCVRVYNYFAFIVGIIVIDGKLVDKTLVVVEHKWQHLFFIPAYGIIVYNRTMDTLDPFVNAKAAF